MSFLEGLSKAMKARKEQRKGSHPNRWKKRCKPQSSKVTICYTF